MTWSNGNEYTHKDIMRMQQEAVERVKDMQERARKAVESSNYPDYPEFAKRPKQSEQHQQPDQHRQSEQYRQPEQYRPNPHDKPVIQIPQSKSSNNNGSTGGLLSGLLGGNNPLSSIGSIIGGGSNGPISRVMDALGIDNDKIIILVLLFILINNQADKKLILALCYILL